MPIEKEAITKETEQSSSKEEEAVAGITSNGEENAAPNKSGEE